MFDILVTALAAAASMLPLGDGRQASSPRVGYVYSCQTSFMPNAPGAEVDGEWIDGSSWDPSRKIAVQGSVSWEDEFSVALSGSNRVLSGNGLPSHPTGTFPISRSDPAYAIDRNPNSIGAYALRASLPRNPRRAARASCVGGTVGVMTTGVLLFNAFDAGGRDAVAHEVQDACDGHPERQGRYHYHSLSDCIRDAGSRHSKLVGWALDGFGIYGLRGVGGEEVTNAGLDACHGHTPAITWNGKRVKMYHYHATLDFPYFVSCYRGTATGGPGA